jgi:glycolate oxidase FAD binding subunit
VVSTPSHIAEALAAACPVRPAQPRDTVLGVTPSFVAQPGTVAQVAAVMRQATSMSLTVVPRGSGSKLDRGAVPRDCDLVVDLSGLDQVIDHTPADMVVDVAAGTPLSRLHDTLAARQQQFPVEEPDYDDGTLAGGTVGGAIATGAAGAARFRYGALRDLLLGITVVLADGTIASSGGRVVKNVAGYDLGKLLTGSHGTLAIVVAATLRLHPIAPATGWVTATGMSAARRLADSPLSPTAVEFDRPDPHSPPLVCARFDGSVTGVPTRCRDAARLSEGDTTVAPPQWFARSPGDRDGTLITIAAAPAALSQVCTLADTASQRTGLAAPLRGSAATGVLHTSFNAESAPAAVAQWLTAVRESLPACGGTAVVVHAPHDVRTRIDPWGPIDPAALRLMRRVKQQFDPDGRLSPGRFVGGM